MGTKKPVKRNQDIHRIKVEARDLDMNQPLGRFLIVLFRQFENQLVHQMRNKGYKDILVSDFNVIRFIEPKGSSVVRIAELAGVSKQLISKQISGLEKRGLVSRVSDATDKRSSTIYFTVKGERLVQDCIGVIKEIEKKHEQILGGSTVLLKLKQSLLSLIQGTTPL